MLHLINVATQCIPLRWKNALPPTINDWHSRVNKIEEMERIIHQAKDMAEKFKYIWGCWTQYRESLSTGAPLTPPDTLNQHTPAVNT